MDSRDRTPILVFLFLFGLVLVLVIASQVNRSGQTAQEPEAGQQVAILVVDAFEALEPSSSPGAVPTTTPSRAESDYCLTTPDGEPHFINSGAANRPISGVANRPISGVANRPISGVAGQILVDPHGRLVYQEFESLIRSRGGLLQAFTLGEHIGADSWIRDIGRWKMLDGEEILLVGVDTEGYTTALIGPRINAAIDFLSNSADFQVTQVVINMSFVILPCDGLQDPVDYAALLQQPEFEDLRNAINTAIGSGENVQDVLVRHPQFVLFREQVVGEMRQDYQQNLDNCYIPLKRDQADDPNQEPPKADQSGAAQDVGVATPTPVANVESTLLATDRCQDLLNENDALARVLVGLVTSPPSGVTSVIPVGASGNSGYSYAFAPGYWSNVVSVGADYHGWETCNPAVMPTNAVFAPPLGNFGEVIMGGLYNCMNGTSFAAPRLSLEAAIYLSRGGAIECKGINSANNGVVSPPLAYIRTDGTPAFDNLSRVEAAVQYCEDFNSIMPLPTPTP